ncbi:MAG: hypothetical protein R3D60_04135 [Paracoccaceae bacterium]
MRLLFRTLPALLLAALVAGACVPAGAGPDAPLTETVLPPPPDAETASTDAQDAVEAETAPEAPPEAVAEATPEPVTPAEPAAPLPPPDPPMLAQQRAACAREGGELLSRGGRQGIYYCAHRTRDAGQRCDEASDCEGICLARSGTCAPLRPLFGCQEVFTDPGRRETLCME